MGVAAPRIVAGPTVAASGAIPQTRTVVMPQNAPVINYTTNAGYPSVVRAGASGAMPVPGSTVRTIVAPGTQVLQAGQVRPNTLAGPVYTQGAYETKHQDDPQLTNLKELRISSGLKHVPVSDGLMTLKASASGGKLTREEFISA